MKRSVSASQSVTSKRRRTVRSLSPSLSARRSRSRSLTRSRSPALTLTNLPSNLQKEIYSHVNGINMAHLQLTSRGTRQLIKNMHPLPMYKIAESKINIHTRSLYKAQRDFETATLQHTNAWKALEPEHYRTYASRNMGDLYREGRTNGWSPIFKNSTKLRVFNLFTRFLDKIRNAYDGISFVGRVVRNTSHLQTFNDYVYDCLNTAKWDIAVAFSLYVISTPFKYAEKIEIERIHGLVKNVELARVNVESACTEYKRRARRVMQSEEHLEETVGYLDGWANPRATVIGFLEIQSRDQRNRSRASRASRTYRTSTRPTIDEMSKYTPYDPKSHYTKGYKKGFKARIDFQIKSEKIK